MFHKVLIYFVVAFALTEQDPQKEGERPAAQKGRDGAAAQKDRTSERNDSRTGREANRGPFDTWLFMRPETSSPIALSNIREVQAELNLSAEQKQAIEEMTKKTGDLQRQMYAEMQRKTREMNQELEKAIKQALDEKQSARMEQLRLQRLGTDSPEIAEKLGLNEEQRAKLAKLRDEFQRAPQTAFSRPSGRGTDAASRDRSPASTQLAETRARVLTDMIAVLTPEQKAKWEELQGPKFDFPAMAARFNGTGGYASPPAPVPSYALRYRSRPFEIGQSTSRDGRQPFMKMVLDMYGPIGPFRHKSVVDALALTEDQKTQLQAIAAADTDASAKITDPNASDTPEKIAQINKDIKERLEKVLTEDQKKKLAEITSQ